MSGQISTIPRHLEPVVRDSLRHFPAVFLVGARQVGKSTLARALADNRWPARILTLDDRVTLDAALSDPDGFVRQAGSPVVFDEVQRAPDLLRAVKLAIDADRAPGRFLLTGSANVVTLARVSETLAGRVAIHRLRPFTLAEMRRGRPVDLSRLFRYRTAAELVRDLERAETIDPRDFVVTGGYPVPALASAPRVRRDWFDAYRQTYVERDVRDVASIESPPDFGRLLVSLARRSSHLVNFSDVSREIGLPLTTLRRYVTLLEQTFQVELLQPFHADIAKRLVRTPKGFLTDSGMVAFLEAIADWRDADSRNAAGRLLETWAHAELRQLCGLSSEYLRLSFWRLQAGGEIDFLVERGEQVVAVEVKAASSLGRRDVAALQDARDALGERWRMGIVLHTGDTAAVIGERVVALPIGAFFGGGWHTRGPGSGGA